MVENRTPRSEGSLKPGARVFAMRRIWESGISRRRVLDVATILLFGFAALVFIGFAPIRGSTVGAVDVVTQQTSPYLESREVFQRSRNPIQTDQTDGIALAATFWRDMQRGEIRMWEPNLGTGAPLGGVVYTRVWSPFYWIGVLVPPNVLTSWAAWLAIWTAQVGAWCLARRLGVGHIGAMLAGIAYGFSGSVTALLFRVNETALAPWVLLAVHLVVSKRSPVRLRAVLGLAVAVALTWLGGFPAGTIMILYAAAAVAIGTVLVESGWQIRVALESSSNRSGRCCRRNTPRRAIAATELRVPLRIREPCAILRQRPLRRPCDVRDLGVGTDPRFIPRRYVVVAGARLLQSG